MELARNIVIKLSKTGKTTVYAGLASSTVGIVSDTLNLDFVLCDQDIEIGNLCSDRFEVELYNTTTDFKGYTVEVYDSASHSASTIDTFIFRGTVENCETDSTRTSVKIEAYDPSYQLGNTNVASWWNSFWQTNASATMATIVSSLFTFVGYNSVLGSKNSTLTIPAPKTRYDILRFADVLRYICEIKAVIPHYRHSSTETKTIEGITLSTTASALSDVALNTYEPSLYSTQAITGVSASAAGTDIFATSTTTGDNNYVIYGNILLNAVEAASHSNAVTALNNIYSALANIVYVPADVDMIVSNLDLTLGSCVSVLGRDNTTRKHYILQMSLYGVQLIEQRISSPATGETQVNSATREAYNDSRNSKSAIEGLYEGTTKVSGDCLVTGTIKSTNFIDATGPFSTQGTMLSLLDGSIKTKNFGLDASGNLYACGTLFATAGSIGALNITETGFSAGSSAGASISIGAANLDTIPEISFYLGRSGWNKYIIFDSTASVGEEILKIAGAYMWEPTLYMAGGTLDAESTYLSDDEDTLLKDRLGGSGGGDYTTLSNKPSINGVTLIGAQDALELGLASLDDLDDYALTTWVENNFYQTGNGLSKSIKFVQEGYAASTYNDTNDLLIYAGEGIEFELTADAVHISAPGMPPAPNALGQIIYCGTESNKFVWKLLNYDNYQDNLLVASHSMAYPSWQAKSTFLSGYATESWVSASYATQSWVESNFYQTGNGLSKSVKFVKTGYAASTYNDTNDLLIYAGDGIDFELTAGVVTISADFPFPQPTTEGQYIISKYNSFTRTYDWDVLNKPSSGNALMAAGFGVTTPFWISLSSDFTTSSGALTVNRSILSGYATQTWVSSNFLGQGNFSTDDFSWSTSASEITIKASKWATQTWVGNQGYTKLTIGTTATTAAAGNHTHSGYVPTTRTVNGHALSGNVTVTAADIGAVRYDTASQGLNATQKSNARTNIGAGTSNLAIGTTATTAAAGNHTHSGYVPTTRTVNGHALSSDVTVTKSDVGLGNVGNFKAVSTVSNQGLTTTEKSNARTNIGAGTSNLAIGTTATTAAAGNHTHSYSSLTGKPTIPPDYGDDITAIWETFDTFPTPSSIVTKNGGTMTGTWNIPVLKAQAPGYTGYWAVATMQWVEDNFVKKCLKAGTLIAMADGTEKPVEEVKPGDLVKSYDIEKGCVCDAVCLNVSQTGKAEAYTAMVFDNNTYVELFGEHDIFIDDRGTLECYQYMDVGEKAIIKDGTKSTFLFRTTVNHHVKSRHYAIVTSNNLYFANGILLGTRPDVTYEYASEIILPENIDTMLKSWTSYGKASTETLIEPEHLAEISDLIKKQYNARHNMEELGKLIAASDYSITKLAEAFFKAFPTINNTGELLKTIRGINANLESIEQREAKRAKIKEFEKEYADATAEIEAYKTSHGINDGASNKEKLDHANKEGNENLAMFKEWAKTIQ